MLYSFREESDLQDETALKIACGLGAGMGRKEEVCGAVTGGILVLGMLHGRGSKDDRAAMEFLPENKKTDGRICQETWHIFSVNCWMAVS